MAPECTFTARVITGSGRGRALGTPTLNLALSDVPGDIAEGVYAVRTRAGLRPASSAVMHYGPRPTFGDTPSCEVHLLEGLGTSSQGIGDVLTVEVVQRLRGIEKFKDAEELKKQMAEDIARARKILEQAPLCHPEEP